MVKWKSPKVWSTHTIETEAKRLNDDIIKVLDEVCPIKVQKFKTKTPTWWTTELHNLRTKVRNTQNEWRNMSSNPNIDQETISKKYNEYKTLRSEFSKTIKKSKRSSWRSFVAECDDIYLLNKIIYKKQQNSISMIEGCNTALQSNNTLLEAHFPGSEPLKSNFPRHKAKRKFSKY